MEREHRNKVLLEVASNLASQPLDTNVLVATIMDQARQLVNADRYVKKQKAKQKERIKEEKKIKEDKEELKMVNHS